MAVSGQVRPVVPGHTVADLFVELGIARVLDADRWLRDLAGRNPVPRTGCGR